MIVKNERNVIKRCLKSVKPIIDHWVIVDTGSDDGTQEIIKEYLKDIPGTLYERPWVNFGYNREEALQLAKTKADYILFLDADDILKFCDNFILPQLEHDFYGIPTSANGIECLLPRLVKATLDWHWHDVLHEYLTSTQATEGVVLEGVEYVYIGDGSRTKDPDRFIKDIQTLENALATDPTNNRYPFYLALAYQRIGDRQNALKYYEKRAEMGGSEEELFISKLNIAKIKESLNFDPKWVEKNYIEAYRFRPSRVEPLYYLAHNDRIHGKYESAYRLATLGIHFTIQDVLMVEKWIYDYGMLFEYAISAFHLQKHEEALLACNQLLSMPQLPIDYKKDTKALLDQMQKSDKGSIACRCLHIILERESTLLSSESTSPSKKE